MSRKTLQKNLSYDERHNLYYVTIHSGRKRNCKTYPTYTAALATLYPGVSFSSERDNPSPEPSATLSQWLDW